MADVNVALTGALVAGGLAAAGYIGKILVEAWRNGQSERRSRQARMLELDSLLAASQSVFLQIIELSKQLSEYLRYIHPDAEADQGYEFLFTTMYSQFDLRAREMHSVIRGYTIAGLAPLNERLLTWLRTDQHERAPRRPTPRERDLAYALRQLERHLVLWSAKFPAWMEDHPEHALVFLGDEQRHGQGFPHGIEHLLHSVLVERGVEVSELT